MWWNFWPLVYYKLTAQSVLKEFATQLKTCYNTILDSFVVSVIPPQPASLPPPSSTPNSTTVILSTTSYMSLGSPASNRSRTLLPVLLLKLLNPLTSLLSYAVFGWPKITERIEYKLLSLTYKVLTTTQRPYLHHLISVQPPRSTRSSSVVTLARRPTSSSLHG